MARTIRNYRKHIVGNTDKQIRIYYAWAAISNRPGYWRKFKDVDDFLKRGAFSRFHNDGFWNYHQYISRNSSTRRHPSKKRRRESRSIIVDQMNDMYTLELMEV